MGEDGRGWGKNDDAMGKDDESLIPVPPSLMQF